MGKKVNPNSFRAGFTSGYNSNWFQKGHFNFSNCLKEDFLIREVIANFFRLNSILVDIPIINRYYGEELEIIINYFNVSDSNHSLERLTYIKSELLNRLKVINNNKFSNYKKIFIKFFEVETPIKSARLIILLMFNKLRRGLPLKRVIKELFHFVEKGQDIQGIKLKISGRLSGEEKANVTYEKTGTLRLQTLITKVDYGFETYGTSYGSVGFKVWISF